MHHLRKGLQNSKQNSITQKIMEKYFLKTPSKQIVCETCGELVDDDKFNKHIKTGHKDKKDMSCNICGKQYSSKILEIFKSKINEFNRIRTFIFTGNFNLQYHIAHHLNLRNFLCQYCTRAYNTQADLSQHLKSHGITGNISFVQDPQTGKRKMMQRFPRNPTEHKGRQRYLPKAQECPICGKLVKHIQKHQEAVHMKLKNHTCQICDKAFYKKSGLTRHFLMVHEEDKNFVCDTCNKAYGEKSLLTRHKKRCGLQKISFFCKPCKKHVSDMKTHCESEHSNLKNPCSTCHRRFETNEKLKNHIFIVHTRKHYCDLCGKGFISKYDVRRHLETHKQQNKIKDSNTHLSFHQDELLNSFDYKTVNDCKKSKIELKEGADKEKSDYKKPDDENAENVLCETETFDVKNVKKQPDERKKCPVCGKLVKNLREHQEAVHMKKTNHSCQACDKRFYKKSALTRHFLMIHEETKSLVCDVCNKGYSEKSLLAKHLKRCRFNKITYLCELCKENVPNIKHHYETKHANLKYSCPTCHRRFEAKEKLESHIYTRHTRKHLCDLCGKRFISKHNVRRHLETHKAKDNNDNNKREFSPPLQIYIQENELIIKEETIEVEAEQEEKTGKSKYEIETCMIKNEQFSDIEAEDESFMDDFQEYVGDTEIEPVPSPVKKSLKRKKEKSKEFPCSECKLVFKSKKDVNKHTNKEHKKVQQNKPSQNHESKEKNTNDKNKSAKKEFPCSECGLVFGYKDGMYRHKNKVHRNIQYKCDHCPLTFTTKFDRTKHVNIHHNYNRENVSLDHMCPLCGVCFSFEHTMIRHRKMVHGDKDPDIVRQCDICQEVCSNLWRKRKHYAQVHLNGKKQLRTCEFCNIGFKLHTDFKEHIKSHTNLHICMICGLYYYTFDQLKTHESDHKRIDVSLRKYCCDICGHRVNLKQQLVVSNLLYNNCLMFYHLNS